MDVTAYDATYRCDACAASFKNPVKVCPQCGEASVNPDSDACTGCGATYVDGRTLACPLCGSDDVERVE